MSKACQRLSMPSRIMMSKDEPVHACHISKFTPRISYRTVAMLPSALSAPSIYLFTKQDSVFRFRFRSAARAGEVNVDAHRPCTGFTLRPYAHRRRSGGPTHTQQGTHSTDTWCNLKSTCSDRCPLPIAHDTRGRIPAPCPLKAMPLSAVSLTVHATAVANSGF